MDKIKLNLGCGERQFKDYINIDIRDIKGVDLIHNLIESLPYKNDTVDEIIAYDVLEHVSFRYTDKMFSDWVRVLKSGGKLEFSVPNLEAHIKLLQGGVTDPTTWRIKKNSFPAEWQFFIQNVFGMQDYKENTHYTTFIPEMVRNLMLRNNLKIKHIDASDTDRQITAFGEK